MSYDRFLFLGKIHSYKFHMATKYHGTRCSVSVGYGEPCSPSNFTNARDFTICLPNYLLSLMFTFLHHLVTFLKFFNVVTCLGGFRLSLLERWVILLQDMVM
jgi:hypothetical protein